MSLIRRNAAAFSATALLFLGAGVGLGVTLIPGSAAAKPKPPPTQVGSPFLQRWMVNSAVLTAAGQYPPTLDLTTGGSVTLTCTPQTCDDPGTVESRNTVPWQLGGPVAVPTGEELVIDNVSFYYIGSGVMAGAGSGSGPGGPAAGFIWLTVAHPSPEAGADILVPLQAVNIPSSPDNPQVAVTGSEHGSWIVSPGDHLLLAGIIMGNLGKHMDATPPVVGFVSAFGHYVAAG